VSDNTIEATISTLRQKLSESFEECEEVYWNNEDSIIETKRGAGYRINGSLVNKRQ